MHIIRYKETIYADLARGRVEELKKAQADAAAKEEQAREAGAKRTEAKRRAAERAKAAAEGQSNKAVGTTCSGAPTAPWCK
jgi:hypothetical protein